MATYSYSAVDSHGKTSKGALHAANQAEALQRIKQMGFYPVKVAEVRPSTAPAARSRRHAVRLFLKSRAATATTPSCIRVKSRHLAVFTRQLSTLLEAGMPLLRGLRLLHEQETKRGLKQVIESLAASIEGGASFSEALSQFPRVFDRLYVNMVKAGEVSGALESTLKRLAEFMDKAARIKARVKAAMFYPAAVVAVATGVLVLMLLVIIPKFKVLFAELTEGRQLPGFTRFVLGVSEVVKDNFLIIAGSGLVLYAVFALFVRTRAGRRMFDTFKLRMPVLGPVFRKLAVARFTRTLGTLVQSGVPILQALTIVKDSTANVVVGRIIERVHENVKQGESIAGPLRGSGVFPPLVVGMVDVGEQTGALPEMLNRIADNYDEEVDNSVAAMTSLLEPILIIFLGVVVGSVVIAMFLAIISIDPGAQGNGNI